MKIILDKNYHIRVSDGTYDLIETGVSKNDKDYQRVIGYCPNLAHAVNMYVTKQLIERDEEVTLKKYVELHDNNVKRIFKELKL